jgi:YbbR domain-containing protein
MDKAVRTRWLTRGVSLAFAVILWFFVTWEGRGLTSRRFLVPLNYQGLPEGYSISEKINNIEVRLEGRLEDLAVLNAADISASVGMSDLRPGKYRLPIQIATPSGMRVENYSPNAVDFELFRMISRSLRPSLVLQGDMPESLALSSVDVMPSEVVVRGPEASVMTVRRAETRGTVEEMSGGTERELQVFLIKEDGETADIEADPPSVLVKAHFTRTMQEARIPVNVQVTGIPGNGLEVGKVTISPDTVLVRGTRDALVGISELTLNPIDVTGHTENMNMDIPLEPPSDSVSILGADRVDLTVEFRTAVETRTFLGVPVALRGELGSSNWMMSPQTVSVTVERPAVPGIAFDPYNPPLELYVDATNVVSSQITLPILVDNAGAGVSVIRIEPQQVTLTAGGR